MNRLHPFDSKLSSSMQDSQASYIQTSKAADKIDIVKVKNKID